MSDTSTRTSFLSATPIATAELRRSLEDRSAGAVVVFEGVVRDHHEGRGVAGLEYVAFDVLAETEWRRLAAGAASRFAVVAIEGCHRTGTLGIGECAVWIGVAAAHRAAAFAACEWLIDSVKRDLPIWKREEYVDGRIDWRHDPVSGQGQSSI
jgi:molybdopterin synthase catalytic subunit